MSIENKEYISVIEDVTIKEAGISEKEIYTTGISYSNAITGGDDFLYYRLKESFRTAKRLFKFLCKA
ncbi:hypothetical protein [Clostridium gasigenes]|uniref:Uncharacterized protein n=1 Tax=Clostridium gasigenes TaxID=94869 RepID=A0A7X0SDK0_9CLOT|nr:hypothetical protein [Clostridium gasigenes]MBB6715564.1 hypothetical protein [Clostridium gasigenes]